MADDAAAVPGAAAPTSRASDRGVALQLALAGALAAACAAVLDGAATWGRLGQFAPSAATRLRTLAYLAFTHGLVGLLAGAGLAAVVLAARASLPRTRRDGVAAGLLVATVVPACTLAAWAVERGLVRAMAHRKHHGLIVTSTEAATLVALVGALAGALVLAAAVRALVDRRPAPEVVVGPLAALQAAATALLGGVATVVASAWVKGAATPRHTPKQLVHATVSTTVLALAVAVAAATLLARLLAPRLAATRVGRALARPDAAGWAAWAALVVVAAALLVVGQPTLALVRARPIYVAALTLALAGPAWLAAAPLARGLGRLAPAPRAALVTALPLALVLVAAAAGSQPVVKGAVAYSGAGDLVTRGLAWVFDADRDGHARWFGGDDCDDLDASVHPGALDLPDDGVDQNCIAGDAHVARTAEDVGMVAVPTTVPAGLNVVLVTIDTLRADHVGAYGYARPTTPALDALAADGARFAASWAHAPSTRYSMPAILTGRLPLQVDYDTSIPGWPGLLPRATTIAELAAARGLTTAAYTNYWYFDPSRRMNQGFAIYDNENARLHQGADPAHTHGSSSKEQTDKALGFLAEHGDQRFFLWIHYYDPHHDYEPHPEVPAFGTDPVSRYDGEIRYTDLHLGRLFDDLRARGLWERTAIVVTGDHGEGFGEHGIDFHGYDLYAAQTRVPLIIRVPGLAPRVVTTAAGHVDILPTIANLLGAPAEPWMMGRSLLGWLAGTTAEDPTRAVFQQVQYEGNHDKRGAADSRCHVLYDISPHTAWQLYDVERDPGETVDRTGAPGRCAATRAAFARWFDAAQIPAGASEALLPGAPDVARPLDIDLGPEIRLLAVDLPAEVKAGSTFDLTFTFAVRGRLPDGWKVFAHFDGPSGTLAFRADHAPPRPIAWWRPGQYIRYTITATVPGGVASGTYGLWTGLWRGNDRRPVTAPARFRVKDNRVEAATVKVVR